MGIGDTRDESSSRRSKFEQSGLDALTAAGCEVMLSPEASGDTLVAAIKKTQAPVLVVRSRPVTEAMMDAGALSLRSSAPAPASTPSTSMPRLRGVCVSELPRQELHRRRRLRGLILAIDRRIPDNVAALRAQKWNKKEFSKADGLFGETLGIIGVGQIGREVVKRARAFRHAGAGLEPPVH